MLAFLLCTAILVVYIDSTKCPGPKCDKTEELVTNFSHKLLWRINEKKNDAASTSCIIQLLETSHYSIESLFSFSQPP